MFEVPFTVWWSRLARATAPAPRAGRRLAPGRSGVWSVRHPGRERERPVRLGVAVDRKSPGEAGAGSEWEGTEVDGPRHVDGRSFGNLGRPLHVELPAYFHGLQSVGRLDLDRSAVGVLEEEFPVVGVLRLVPAHVHLEGDGRRGRPWTDHAPPSAENEQLAVSHLGGVTQHHGYFHVAKVSGLSNGWRTVQPPGKGRPAPKA